MIAKDNLVMVFLNTTATQRGMNTWECRLPKKLIVMRTADLFGIEDEMIVEHSDVVNSLNLLIQTGGRDQF
jgi:predicted SnoaL-like aldol condensation-catalyzing enzyme